MAETGFDQFASNYDAALAEGLSATGEDKHYFARGRVAWVARLLARLNERPASLLDFGCGTGTSTPYFRELPGLKRVVGVEVSAKSIEVARQRHGAEGAEFFELREFEPRGEFDAAFCNGVFHHVPVDERAAALNYIRRCLHPRGLFFFWENNPWNPGTRWVMSRIPFDRDAVLISPVEGRRLLRAAGFEVLRTDFLFIFPRQLRWLRCLETPLHPLPLGGQYLILARAP